jgi:hypothetical protein
MEESRTNLTAQSANISAWSGGFTNNGATTAPDGTSSGYSAVIGLAACQSPITTNVTGLHSATVFLKRNNTDWIRFRLTQGSNTNVVTAWINLATGAVGTVSATAGTPTSLSATITSYANGWYRCSVTASFPATSYLFINLASATADGIALSVAGSIYEVWGGQIEAGSFPTSYIPTTTASVVRSADVCSITGADFTGMYNEFAGTVLCESTLNGVSPSVTPNTAIFGGPQNGISMRENTGTPSLFGIIAADEDNYFDSSMGNTPSGTARKSAMTFQNDGSAILCLDGTLGTQDNSIILPIDSVGGVTPAELILFRGQFSTVKSFRYYKKRLANAKLQSLTT